MAVADRQRADEALDWVRRIHDRSFMDWEAHATWLEADPRNLDAFDDASQIIATATADLTPPRRVGPSALPTNDNFAGSIVVQRRWSRWGVGLGIAVAAGLVAVIAVPSIMQDSAQPYALETKAGERRSIILADGTTIALNGDSRVRLDRSNMRVAALERGEAFFRVKHDAAHPFEVRAGDSTFQDVGTAFDVIHRAGLTQVAVHEGAVLYDPGGAAVRLDPGQSVRIADNSATVQAVDTAAVGGWRSGRLLYRDAPLNEVASDVARSIGEPISVDPALAQRHFSGVVMIDTDRPLMFHRMSVAMGVGIQHASKGWRMVMPSR
jgi:transmembrane sensor